MSRTSRNRRKRARRRGRVVLSSPFFLKAGEPVVLTKRGKYVRAQSAPEKPLTLTLADRAARRIYDQCIKEADKQIFDILKSAGSFEYKAYESKAGNRAAAEVMQRAQAEFLSRDPYLGPILEQRAIHYATYPEVSTVSVEVARKMFIDKLRATGFDVEDDDIVITRNGNQFDVRGSDRLNAQIALYYLGKLREKGLEP